MHRKFTALAFGLAGTGAAFAQVTAPPVTILDKPRIEASLAVGQRQRPVDIDLCSFQLTRTLDRTSTVTAPTATIANAICIGFRNDHDDWLRLLARAEHAGEQVDLTLRSRFMSSDGSRFTTTIRLTNLTGMRPCDDGCCCGHAVRFDAAGVTFTPDGTAETSGTGNFDISFFDPDSSPNPPSLFQDYPDFGVSGMTVYPNPATSPATDAQVFYRRHWLGDSWLNGLLEAEAADPNLFNVPYVPLITLQVTPETLLVAGTTDSTVDPSPGTPAPRPSFEFLGTLDKLVICASEDGTSKETVWFDLPVLPPPPTHGSGGTTGAF
jgi:hypothetical protein